MKSPEPLPKAESDTDAPQHNGRKMLFDFGPLLLFFGTNYIYSDLMLSVKVLVAATLVSLALSWHFDRKISVMAAVGCAALMFFAGLTLYFENELFIKIKPIKMPIIYDKEYHLTAIGPMVKAIGSIAGKFIIFVYKLN